MSNWSKPWLTALVLAVAAFAETWWVFGPRAERPPATQSSIELQAKASALFAASFKPVGPARVELQNLKGKPVVAYFWPSWCAECASEVRALQSLQEQHRAGGLVVLGFGVDQADRIAGFAKVNAIDFPVFAGGQAAIDLSKQMGNLRAGMPFVVAIDRRGQVAASHLGKFGPQTAHDMVAQALR